MAQEGSKQQKEWLYRQGTWESINRLDDDTFDKLFIEKPQEKSQQKPRKISYGLHPSCYLDIYLRNKELDQEVEPTYEYFVDLCLQDKADSFYIADYPSYLQLVPQLIDHVEKALRLAQLVKQIKATS